MIDTTPAAGSLRAVSQLTLYSACSSLTPWGSTQGKIPQGSQIPAKVMPLVLWLKSTLRGVWMGTECCEAGHACVGCFYDRQRAAATNAIIKTDVAPFKP